MNYVKKKAKWISFVVFEQCKCSFEALKMGNRRSFVVDQKTFTISLSKDVVEISEKLKLFK